MGCFPEVENDTNDIVELGKGTCSVLVYFNPRFVVSRCCSRHKKELFNSVQLALLSV